MGMNHCTKMSRGQAPENFRSSRELVADSIRAKEGDGNERKFILSFSSEEPYERWWGTEILDHSEGCVDLGRIKEIGCVLFNHKRDDVIGKVLRAWVENGRGMAEIEFDTDELSEKIYQKVKSGTLKGVSVGYVVSIWEEVASNKKSTDGRFNGEASIAKRWEIYEISIVSVPADKTVGVGRGTGSSNERAIQSFIRQLNINKNFITGGSGKTMKKRQVQQKIMRQQEIMETAKKEHRDLSPEEAQEFDTLQREIDNLQEEIAAEERRHEGQDTQKAGSGETAGGIIETGEKSHEADAAQIREQERQRVYEIASMCREFGLDDQKFIKDGTSVDEVRAAVIDQMRKSGAPIGGRVVVETDEQDKFRAAAADALIMRGGVQMQNYAPGARDMMGMSLKDLAMECLEAEGESGVRRKSADELFDMVKRQFYNPAAAFPTIMDNAINKAYVEGHKTAPVTFDRWTQRGALKDFKTHDNNYLSGPVGELVEVPEGGELKHDVWKDAKRPTRKLKTYGKQFTMSRQAFINDDVGLITMIPAKYAASARKTQNKQCYQLLINNDNIYDGHKLFGKEHFNLLAKGTGITRESVQGMIMVLTNQKDEFGEVCLIRPAALIVPSGYKFDMYTMFYSPTIHTSDNTQAVNPLYQYRESIEVIEDPTINALCGGFGNVMPWWLVGAKEDTDFIEVDYLNGQDVPNIRRSEVAGTLGFVWDIYLDWAVNVMDYRGAVKNPGVAVKIPVELA